MPCAGGLLFVLLSQPGFYRALHHMMDSLILYKCFIASVISQRWCRRTVGKYTRVRLKCTHTHTLTCTHLKHTLIHKQFHPLFFVLFFHTFRYAAFCVDTQKLYSAQKPQIQLLRKGRVVWIAKDVAY